MVSQILTSAEIRINLQQRNEKRIANKKKKEQAASVKKTRQPTKKQQTTKRKMKAISSSEDESSDDEESLCVICAKKLPPQLSRANSIRCIGLDCHRIAHLKCANPIGSYFECKNCVSDVSDEAQSEAGSDEKDD